jgi:predicted permease
MSARPHPPPLARALLALRFTGDALEVVRGDLLEYFERDLAAGMPVRRARRRYWRLAVQSLAGVSRRESPEAAIAGPDRARGLWTSLSAEIRFGCRRLVHNPGFTLVAVLTLALAIGANAALFTALSRVVLSPLPFDRGHRMVFLWRGSPAGDILLSPTSSDIDRWKQLDVFERIEAFTGRTVVLLDGGEPREISAGLVTPSVLDLLGTRPMLGRSLAVADTASDAEPALLLGYDLWLSRFGGDRAVTGRIVRLGDERWRVVGVMPRGFFLPMGSEDMWLARREAPDRGQNTIALLREGVTVDDARAALQRVAADTPGGPAGSRWVGHVMPPGDMSGQRIRRTLVMLSVAVGLLLLMACVNVAGLTTAGHRRRRRELAVRASMGASRAQLARMLLIESALLAAIGGALGLLTARAGLSALAALRPDTLDVLANLRLDGDVVRFALAVTTLAALLVGVVPALRASTSTLSRDLAAGGRGSTATGLLGRGVLGAFQVAVALTLVIGTLLLTRSVGRLTAVDPGYDADGVFTMALTLDGDRYADAAVRGQFFDDLRASLAALPGVTSVAIGNGVAPEFGIIFGTVEVEGQARTGGAPEVISGGSIGPGYFQTLRLPIVKGRAFTDDDIRSGAEVALVSEGMARHLRPGGDVLGTRFRIGGDGGYSSIVGIAADVHDNRLPGDARQVYMPLPAKAARSATLIVRTEGPPAAMFEAARSRVWALDAELPIGPMTTARDRLRATTGQHRFAMTLLGAFAGLGLLLAAVGVFGTLMLVVAERRREMAVRLSLGATHGRVVIRVMRDVGWMTAAGLMAGTAAALAAAPYIRSLLFGVAPVDAISFAAGLTAVTAAALVATIAPVRRMLSVAPAEALRAD